MSVYRLLVRPLLFRLDPEVAHHATIRACRVTARLPAGAAATRAMFSPGSTRLRTEVAGLTFPHPIGLAAGWDKSGTALGLLASLGFGFAEIGSVSARPSSGNPRPRLFRLPKDRALVVNYGLPNDGAEAVARRLAEYRRETPIDVGAPIGVNLVKTNDGPEAPPCGETEILDDYHASFVALHRLADYVTLNLSCPNAEGGKDHFAEPGRVRRLLERLADAEPAGPVFLKVAPDPRPESIERLIEEAGPFPFVRGWIFNLPPGKPPSLSLTTPPDRLASMPGAVSGRPVSAVVDRCIAEMNRRSPRGRFAIVAAGGVFTGEDAYAKIRLGASLVQIYTALIYEGPGVIKRIHRGLCRALDRDGFRTLDEAVGSDPKVATPHLSD